jgi:glutathione S-transferase
MITVYAAYNVPFNGKSLVRDFRIIWALEELGLPYAFHWMDVGKAEHKIDPNRGINPFGKIPSIADGEVKLFESGAILHYLYEKAGKLPADAAARARQLQWMFAALNTLEPPCVELLAWTLFFKDRPGRDIRYPELIEHAKLRATELDKTLGKNTYLLGEAFGPADILMVSVLDFAKHEPSIVENAPNLRAYLERAKARPAYRRALAKHLVGPDAKAA